MSDPAIAHCLMVASPWRGHLNPAVNFALSLLLEFPNLYVTLLIQPLAEKAAASQIAWFAAPQDAVKRLHVVRVGDSNHANPAVASLEAANDFKDYLRDTFGVGTSGRSLPTPSVILIDIVLSVVVELLKKEKIAVDVPVIELLPLNLGFRILMGDPRSPLADVFGKAQKLIDTVPEMKGLSIIECLQPALASGLQGKLVTDLPGIVPVLDYELLPQSEAIPFDPAAFYMALSSQQSFGSVDGVATISFPDMLEPGVAEYMERDLGKKCFAVGPQYPAHVWEKTSTSWTKDSHADVLEFLNLCLEKHGGQSVMYISFGTVAYPANRPDLLHLLVETLSKTTPPVPFVWAASAFNPELIEALEATRKEHGGIGLVTKEYVPQVSVLAHKATGWFLTHGGSNSVSESLIEGVPLVFWPCMTDQPSIAAQLCVTHEAAYELVQIRTGPLAIGRPSVRTGGKPISGTREDVLAEMNETWRCMRGVDGEKKRARTRALGDAARESWRSGVARQALRSFSQYF